MNIFKFLKDERFNIFFSVILGIGIVCIFRPKCIGSECNVSKPPKETDFDKFVYRMGTGKCYEFKTEITECPPSGAIEAFREATNLERIENTHDVFSRRITPLKDCE